MSYKILVVSDTHGDNERLYDLLETKGPFNMLIHCGDSLELMDYIGTVADCEAVGVRGNCDIYSSLPAQELVEVKGHRIFVTHGHLYQISRIMPLLAQSGFKSMVREAEQRGADIVLYGHTHVPDISYSGRITVMNPGSLSQPRQKTRKYTYGIIEIHDDGRADCNIQEMD